MAAKGRRQGKKSKRPGRRHAVQVSLLADQADEGRAGILYAYVCEARLVRGSWCLPRVEKQRRPGRRSLEFPFSRAWSWLFAYRVARKRIMPRLRFRL